MIDTDFVRKYCEEKSEPFNNACEEMIEHRDQMDFVKLKDSENIEQLKTDFQNLQDRLNEFECQQEIKEREQKKAQRKNEIATAISILIAFLSLLTSWLS